MPSLKGAAMSDGKNALLTSVCAAAAGSAPRTCGAEQLLERVEAQEGGEQVAGRRHVRERRGDLRRHVLGGQAGEHGAPARGR